MRRYVETAGPGGGKWGGAYLAPSSGGTFGVEIGKNLGWQTEALTCQSRGLNTKDERMQGLIFSPPCVVCTKD